MAIFIRESEITFEDHPKFPGVRIAKLVTGKDSEQVGISILEVAPGVEIPVHTHDSSIDSIYVLEGAGRAFVNGEWQGISAGDYILVQTMEEHGVKSDEDGGLRLFIVHSPPLF